MRLDKNEPYYGKFYLSNQERQVMPARKVNVCSLGKLKEIFASGN